jgi:hypothetical protein
MEQMSPEEAQSFYQKGVENITQLAYLATRCEEFTQVFEARGGAVGMGDELGPTTELFIGVFNDLAAMLAANNGWDQQVLDKYRSDY